MIASRVVSVLDILTVIRNKHIAI